MSIFFGIPEGVSEGDIFPSRRGLIESRLHRSTQRGIDGNSTDGSSAIVISDGYIDDYGFGGERSEVELFLERFRIILNPTVLYMKSSGF